MHRFWMRKNQFAKSSFGGRTKWVLDMIFYEQQKCWATIWTDSRPDESGGSLHPCSPPGLAAELRPPGREQLEGRSFVASSSLCLLPPPQEALQCKTSERKYYSCKRARWRAQFSVSLSGFSSVSISPVHCPHPGPHPGSKGLAEEVLTLSLLLAETQTLC